MKTLIKNRAKNLSQFGFALLFGLISTFSKAEQEKSNTVIPTQAPKTEQTQLATNHTALNPNIVNINNATAAEIQDKLVGIGAKKAQAIIDYREKNGKFINIEQLTEVSGIGKATLDKNRDRIVLE